MCMSVYVSIHVNLCLCTYMCVCVFVCLSVCVHACVICMHVFGLREDDIILSHIGSAHQLQITIATIDEVMYF